MTRERIEKIRDSKQRSYLRQFDNFQSTGETKYMTRATAYEELVDICNQALSTVDDHQKNVHITADLIRCAGKAADLIHHWNEDLDHTQAKNFLYEFITVAKMYGFDNRWEG